MSRPRDGMARWRWYTFCAGTWLWFKAGQWWAMRLAAWVLPQDVFGTIPGDAPASDDGLAF